MDEGSAHTRARRPLRGAFVRRGRGSEQRGGIRRIPRYSYWQGGPVPPTGKRVEADYVYIMEFEGDLIRNMTKVWNDGVSLKQLGWMQ